MIVIHAPARKILNAFWETHPSIRAKCVKKYGFDPILEEAKYWPPGIREKDHANILRDLKLNNYVFSVSLARRWVASELKQ